MAGRGGARTVAPQRCTTALPARGRAGRPRLFFITVEGIADPEMPIDWARLESLNSKANRISLLVYQGPDGFPVVDPMLTVSSRVAGRFAMFTMKASPKMASLRKDPRASLTVGCVTDGDYAICKSQVRVLTYGDNPELFKEVYESCGSKYIRSPDDEAYLILLFDIDEVVWCGLAEKVVEKK